MHTTLKTLAAAGIAACAVLIALPAHAQQFTMKLSQPTINDVTHEYFKRMKAGIESGSKGRIKVDIYPANQLGQLPAVVEGVALGTIEAASSANGFWISLEPRFQVLDAPGLFDDIPHGFKMLNDPGDPRPHGDMGRRQGHRDSRALPLQPADAAEPQGDPRASATSRARRSAPRAARRFRSSR